MCQLWNIVTKENIPPESVVICPKLQSMLRRSTANTRIIKEATRPRALKVFFKPIPGFRCANPKIY
jgi:hypothetical protein